MQLDNRGTFIVRTLRSVLASSLACVPHKPLQWLAASTQAGVVSFRNLYNQSLSGSLPDAWSALSQVSLELHSHFANNTIPALVTLCKWLQLTQLTVSTLLTCQFVQLERSLIVLFSLNVPCSWVQLLCSLVMCKQCCGALASAWPGTKHRP